MSSFSFEEIQEIEKFVKEAGEYLLSFLDQNLVVLSEIGSDIKLEADQSLEKKIVQFLKDKFNYPVLGEEFGATSDFGDLTGFVVDPIDGTMNFSRRNPIFCISIGFLFKGKPLLGIIYNPVLKEMFTGIVGDGFYFNGQKCHPETSISKMDKAILVTGIPTKMSKDREPFHDYLDRIRGFKKVRMIGSAAQSLAWIGIGRFDFYMENSIMLWDIAAGLAIVESIGGEFEIKRVSESDWKYDVIASINKDLMQAYKSEFN